MAAVPPEPDLWTLVALVETAANDAVRRVRNRSAGWWRAGTRNGTRADVVARLVAEIAAVGLALEGEPHRTAPPPVREAVLADQLAVVTYDLVLALRANPEAGAAARALDELLVHGHEVDRRRVQDGAAAAVLAARYPEASAGELAPGDLLLRVHRCPGGGDVA